VVFLGPTSNAELVPKFHVALHASHVALPMVTLKISPYTNITLTFDFDFGLNHSVHRDMGKGAPHREESRLASNGIENVNVDTNVRVCVSNSEL
jgi:hypothetical protein